MHPPEVVALLSTRMPAGTRTLKVHDSAQAPMPPIGQVRDPFAEMLLAHWLDVPAAQVRFYRHANDREAPQPVMLPPQRWSTQERAVDAEGVADERAGAQGLPPFPHNWPRDGQPGALSGTGPGPDEMHGAWESERLTPASRYWMASPLPCNNPTAAGAPWNRRVAASGEFKTHVVLLFLAGLLANVPLAWWFRGRCRHRSSALPKPPTAWAATRCRRAATHWPAGNRTRSRFVQCDAGAPEPPDQ